jgi:thioredoxin-related protein
MPAALKNILMNRISIVLTALIIVAFVIHGKAQKAAEVTVIPWTSFEKAIETNQKAKPNKKKKIFIDVYTDWCGWCTHMENTTFHDSTVVDLMNKYFIAVKLNAERKDTVKWNDTYYVNPNPKTQRSTHQLAITLLKGQLAYPAFVFMDTEEKVIVIIKGFREAKEFITILKYYGEDIYLTKSWAEYEAESPK